MNIIENIDKPISNSGIGLSVKIDNKPIKNKELRIKNNRFISKNRQSSQYSDLGNSGKFEKNENQHTGPKKVYNKKQINLDIIELSKLLHKPTFLRIIYFFKCHKICYVSEISNFFNLSYSQIHNHLKILNDDFGYLTEITNPTNDSGTYSIIQKLAFQKSFAPRRKLKFYTLTDKFSSYLNLIEEFAKIHLPPWDLIKIRKFERTIETLGIAKKKKEENRTRELKERYEKIKKEILRETISKKLSFPKFTQIVNKYKKQNPNLSDKLTVFHIDIRKFHDNIDEFGWRKLREVWGEYAGI